MDRLIHFSYLTLKALDFGGIRVDKDSRVALSNDHIPSRTDVVDFGM